MIGAVGLLAILLMMVITQPPGKLTELIGVTLLAIAIFLSVDWYSGKKKWGLIASLGLIGILLMNRWEILDWLSLGLWVIVLGVVGLVN